MHNLIVTGVAGYIGASFAHKALSKGYQIYGVDSFINSDEKNIEYLKQEFGKNFRFLKLDLSKNKELINELKSIENIDAVVHFAGLKSVPESEKTPKKYWDNNVGATKNILDLMKKKKINKIIFSSSAAVYGENFNQPLDENACTYPKSVYAKTKLECEKLIEIFSKKNNSKAIILRYFNPIGSDLSTNIYDHFNSQNPNVLRMIIKSITEQKKFIIYGNNYDTYDGTGERDYIHIADLVSGHLKSLNAFHKVKDIEIYNLGTGEPTSVLKLLETFKKVNNVTVDYLFEERRQGDIAISYTDPSKAKKELEWDTIHNIENMCRDSWVAMKNELRNTH